MIIKKAKYKKVRTWINKQVSPEVYGCDLCKNEIKEYPNEDQRLEMTVWPNKTEGSTIHYHFCSWECVLKFIPTIKSNYFVSLPFLYFDESTKKSAKELTKLIKKIFA